MRKKAHGPRTAARILMAGMLLESTPAVAESQVVPAESSRPAATSSSTRSDSPMLVLETAHDAPDDAPELKLPSGAHLARLASLDSPRMLHITDHRELLIGSRAGRLYRGQLSENGTLADMEVLVRLSDYPHSVVVRESTLFVATTDALLAADYTPGKPLSGDDFREVIAIAGGGGHNSRTLSLGPDGGLYLALGIQGNCSDQYLAGSEPGYPTSERRGGVMRLMEREGKPHWQPWASGLRNPVGLAWQIRQEGEPRLLATNNGPDHWGYEYPRELVVAANEGSFHGMPWYQWVDGQWQADDCITSTSPRDSDALATPLAEIPARSAPMGITVVPAGHPMAAYMDVVIAVHGSWGTAPEGVAWGDAASRRAPSLMGIKFGATLAQTRSIPLLTGLQDRDDGQRWIRPLDVAFGPDGSLYMTSDSGASGLYRITFK